MFVGGIFSKIEKRAIFALVMYFLPASVKLRRGACERPRKSWGRGDVERGLSYLAGVPEGACTHYNTFSYLFQKIELSWPLHRGGRSDGPFPPPHLAP